MKIFLPLYILLAFYPLRGLPAAEKRDDILDERPVKEKTRLKEVAKGYFTKIDTGYFIYLGRLLNETSAGSVIGISTGYDILELGNLGITGELTLYQGINRGNPNSSIIQGNFRSTLGDGALRLSYFFIPRFCAFLKGGGGVFYSEKLKEGQGEPGLHGSIKFFGGGGTGFEYYTKLSHFSLGVEADFFYIMGVDYAMAIYPMVKYTF